MKTTIRDDYEAARARDPMRWGYKFVMASGSAMPGGVAIVGGHPKAGDADAGRAFGGMVGEVVKDAVRAAGALVADAYLTNISKYVYAVPGSPAREQLAPFVPALLRELRARDPRTVVVLGGVAASALGVIGRPSRLSSALGKGHKVNLGGPITPCVLTYAPRFVAREGPDSAAEWQFREDVARAFEIARA